MHAAAAAGAVEGPSEVRPGGWAYLTYPLFMSGFMALSAWCLLRGLDPGVWIPALTVLNFLVVLALEQLFPRRPHMNTLRDRQSVNDALHGVLTGALRPLGTSLGILVVAHVSAWWPGLGGGALWPSDWSLLAQVLLAHALVTFAGYWVHRSLHEIDRLWWFHAIHHDTAQLHVLKSGRFHFVDEIYNAILTPLPLLVLGVPTEVVVLRSMWSVFNGSLAHANTVQRFPGWVHAVVSTVDLHNLHHARERRFQDSNYAGLPLWDILFGTFNHPHRCHASRFGLDEGVVPRRFLAQLWFPFRAQLRAPVADPPAP